MAKSTLNIDQELHSDSLIYRIESVLGQGSFGITYKAKAFTVIKGKFGEELVETNTPKAIKEFFMREVNEREESGSITGMSKGGLSYNYAQKFKKEAENLASMNHPNIVKVIDFISANNTYYYVMDFIEGENLNDYLKHHKMSEKEATDTIMEVAKALKYMHEEKHMLHLDLKPRNIMRRESDGHIFLIDFGLSKHYSEEGVPETSTSVGLGTPGYAPIEQANSKNAKKFRETLDVYALGATFYKLLTGQTPPSADELVSDGDVVKEELAKLGINGVLTSVVVNAMKPSVKERIQNVAEFLDSFNPKDSQSDVIVVCTDNDATTIDVQEKVKEPSKKKTATKPKIDRLKKETKTNKETRGKTGNAVATTVVKEEKESSNSGCLKMSFILVALCLFLLWYNDMWIFSSENEPNNSASEQVVGDLESGGSENAPQQLISTRDDSEPTEAMTEEGRLFFPSSPTSITSKNRTIRDLLYFPYGCLPKEIDTKEKAQEALSSNFGSYEVINVFGIGLHKNKHFDYAYKGATLGVSYISWSENENWYRFYLKTKAEADKFYNVLVEDIIKAGVPLKKDKVYGDFSNRNHPVSIFKWVYVSPTKKIEKADNSNVDISDYVGMYCVELGVYKRNTNSER